MNIILIPEGIRKGRTASFTQRHVAIILVTTALILPAVLGTVSYQIIALLDQSGGVQQIEHVQAQQEQLAAQQLEIEQTRLRTGAHLNALAQRLGHLQAQAMRLDALGARLTRMAGLDASEFDFSGRPPVGGPAARASATQQFDVFGALDTLDSKMAQQSDQLTALQTLLINRQTQSATMPAGWPVTGGWLSSRFGMRADPFTGRNSMHRGVDIASPLGSSIKAIGDGVISYAGEKQGYGLLVEIKHGQGFSTRYAHASKVLVNQGDRVVKGQEVALVGISGRSTGPHLHLEVLQNRAQVDPEIFLQQNNTTTARKRGRVAHDST
ncbi:MAG: M23 family metallopeptidase [Acidiferrobacterales bacterium]